MPSNEKHGYMDGASLYRTRDDADNTDDLYGDFAAKSIGKQSNGPASDSSSGLKYPIGSTSDTRTPFAGLVNVKVREERRESKNRANQGSIIPVGKGSERNEICNQEVISIGSSFNSHFCSWNRETGDDTGITEGIGHLIQTTCVTHWDYLCWCFETSPHSPSPFILRIR